MKRCYKEFTFPELFTPLQMHTNTTSQDNKRQRHKSHLIPPAFSMPSVMCNTLFLHTIHVIITNVSQAGNKFQDLNE